MVLPIECVLEGDSLTLYGVFVGVTTYEPTNGGPITIPAVLVDRLEIN